ncbi:MAG: hypothetical protein ACI8S6_000221 [Myxococcota bacterium]|jgi:hypothetical protein
MTALWVLSGCGGPPPCPVFPGDLPIDRGVAAEGADWDALDARIVSELQARGCRRAIRADRADLSGMFTESAVCLSASSQEVRVDVDESGTRAAGVGIIQGRPIIIGAARSHRRRSR